MAGNLAGPLAGGWLPGLIGIRSTFLCAGLMLANISIEPIITVYVCTLVSEASQITKVAGYVMAAAALGSIISASWLGKLADRIGHLRIITLALTAAGLLLILQAFVTSGWQLIALRFLMGLALGGLLPCIAAVIRHRVPEEMVGSILGYSVAGSSPGR